MLKIRQPRTFLRQKKNAPTLRGAPKGNNYTFPIDANAPATEIFTSIVCVLGNQKT